MAQINQINGVATSGTTGVNNLFGSGGGSATVTSSPTFTVRDSTAYFGNGLTVTNHASYTNADYLVTVIDGSGTVIASDSDVNRTTASGLTWADSGADGTRTVKVRAQEFGDSTQSAEVTSTYTKSTANFQFYRVTGLNSSKAPTTLHWKCYDWNFYTGSSQTGTSHPLVTLSANNDNDDYKALAGQVFNTSYAVDHPWDFSSNNYWWSLGTSAANNWLGFEFRVGGASSFGTVGAIPDILSMDIRIGSGTPYYGRLEGSTTGAFAGEQVLLEDILMDSNSTSTHNIG